MGNDILNMINERKNRDFFVQMHPLRVKLSIEEKIYYLNAIKYLAGEDNNKVNDFLTMFSESFHISEDMYNDEDINLMEDGLDILNSLNLRAKMVLVMDSKIINSSKDINEIIQIEEDIIKNIDSLFNMIKNNNEKIIDFFEENEDFIIDDYLYLIEYSDIDISLLENRKKDDKITKLNRLEKDIIEIYRSMLLSKEYIKRELDKTMNTSMWKRDFLSKNLPIYIKEEACYEDYDDLEDFFESGIQRLRGYFRERMKVTRMGVEPGIKNILKIINNEYDEKKKVINTVLDTTFSFKTFNFNINVENDIKLPDGSHLPIVMATRSKKKKKMWSKDIYFLTCGKISWMDKYKQFGRDSVDKILDDTQELVYKQLSDFINSEIKQATEFIQKLKIETIGNLDIKVDFMELSNLDLEESISYIEALGLIVNVDKEISNNEKEYLQDLIKSLKINKSLEEILNLEIINKNEKIDNFKELFLNNVAKNNFIYDAYKISLLDGEIKKENQELIDYFVKFLGIEKKVSEKVLEKVKYESIR